VKAKELDPALKHRDTGNERTIKEFGFATASRSEKKGRKKGRRGKKKGGGEEKKGRERDNY